MHSKLQEYVLKKEVYLLMISFKPYFCYFFDGESARQGSYRSGLLSKQQLTPLFR